jgi:hypothetical protein
MTRILHVCVRRDERADAVIKGQREQGDAEIIVVDLVNARPDYDGLITEILAADRIAVWS